VELFPGKTGELFTLEFPPAPDSQGPPSLVFARFDLTKRKSEQIVAGIQNASVSFNGENFSISRANPGSSHPPRKRPSPAKARSTRRQEVWSTPREWKQITTNLAHRTRFLLRPQSPRREFAGSRHEYEPYLDRIATRDDLNYLFQQMLSEINVGHMFVGGGDVPEVQQLQVACSEPITVSKTATTVSPACTREKTGIRSSTPRSPNPASTSSPANIYSPSMAARFAPKKTFTAISGNRRQADSSKSRTAPRRLRLARSHRRSGAGRNRFAPIAPGWKTISAK